MRSRPLLTTLTDSKRMALPSPPWPQMVVAEVAAAKAVAAAKVAGEKERAKIKAKAKARAKAVGMVAAVAHAPLSGRGGRCLWRNSD